MTNDNDEVLNAFREFIEKEYRGQAGIGGHDLVSAEAALRTVRELAAAIDPERLEEVTLDEIKTFVRDHKVKIPSEKSVLGASRERFGGAMQARREAVANNLRYELSMEWFCQFRRKV